MDNIMIQTPLNRWDSIDNLIPFSAAHEYTAMPIIKPSADIK
jgi:hypothetical protein